MTNDFNEYSYLCHHGVLGMKWGVRRYQNPDGTLTAAGRKRYGGKQAERWRSDENKRYDKKIAKAEKKGKTAEATRYKAEKAGLNKMTEDQLGDELLRIKRNTDKGTILGGPLAGAGAGLATLDSVRKARSFVESKAQTKVADIPTINQETDFKSSGHGYEKVYPQGSDALKGTSADKEFYFSYDTKTGVSKDVVNKIMGNIKTIDKTSQEYVVNDIKADRLGVKEYVQKRLGVSDADKWIKDNTHMCSVRYIDDKGWEDFLEVSYDVGDLMFATVEYNTKTNKPIRVGFDD